jgi:hypothetical protein
MTGACERSLATCGISYSSVHAILKNGLDRVPVVVDASSKVVPIQHANLRGSAYYQQALLEA